MAISTIGTNGLDQTNNIELGATGNVGIGTTTPLSKLTIDKAASGARGGEVSIVNSAGAVTGAEAAINFGFGNSSYDANNGNAQIKAYCSYGANESTDLVFVTWDGSNFLEKLRITAAGNVQLSQAGFSFLNSSGNPILQQTGSVLQVVQANVTGTANTPYFSTTTNGLVDTGLSVTITPTSSTSKILVIISPAIYIIGASTDSGTGFGIKRNSSNIYSTSNNPFYSANTNAGSMLNIVYLDSPATTSSTTYQLQVSRYQNNGGTTVYLNKNYQGVDISTITVMEIAA